MNRARPLATTDGYQRAATELTTLISAHPPPFIYVYDPGAPRLACKAITAALEPLKENNLTPLAFAHVNAVACFNPRLLYDTALNALTGWRPKWDEGCSNWTEASGGTGQRFNESFDGFTHGLRAVRSHLVEQGRYHLSNGHGKGKEKEKATAIHDACRLVLVIERAERLKDSVPDLLVPLARLAELSRVDITTIWVSEVQWEQVRPSYGAAPDPYYVDIQGSSKSATIERLMGLYPSSLDAMPSTSEGRSAIDRNTYHPALEMLYSHFLSTLYSICSPFTTDFDELAYIAAATWPGFIRPVLDDYYQIVQEHREALNERNGVNSEIPDSEPEGLVAEDSGSSDPPLTQPTEDTRIRLTRLFTPVITAALDALYPRNTNAAAWARANIPPPDLLGYHPRQMPSLPAKLPEDQGEEKTLRSLPRMAKFVLVASFLASTNPHRTDMRMFGRGRDERKRRRKGGSPRKITAKNAAVKIPQRLLGPMPFPLDRMIAILGVLLEENDADTRPPAPEYTVPGEYTEMELCRVALFGQIMELASMHLLYRTSPSDRLEMSPMFKCGASYDTAFVLAKDIGVKLNDLVWDPV